METSIVSVGIHGMDLSYVRQVMMGQYVCGNINHHNIIESTSTIEETFQSTVCTYVRSKEETLVL
jgi:hypothetical protein